MKNSAETVIPIYLCCDENYAPQLCTVAASVVDNTQSPLHFIVLTAGLSDSAKSNIAKACGANEVSFVSVAEYSRFFDEFPLLHSHISIATCYRYLIPLLDFPYEKGIYLDCDVLVCGDIRGLFDYDISDAAIAGADDFISTSHPKTLGLDRYFNAGVLLLNIKKMRAQNAAVKLLEKTLELRDKIKYLDQDVLNVFFKGESKILPPKFGAVSSLYRKNAVSEYFSAEEIREAVYSPIVVHFTGPDKPWLIPFGITAHPWTPLFLHYWKTTAYADLLEKAVEKFNPVGRFFWYWKRHLGFFLRPQFFRMRKLYARNLKKYENK